MCRRRAGLYLLDVVPDGEVRWGFPNISDIQEIGELIACGSHVTLFTTGRGSVVGSAISPVIKICANPETYRRLSEDMDVNAGRILEGAATLEEVGREIYDRILRVAAGDTDRQRSHGPCGVLAGLQKLRAARPGVSARLGCSSKAAMIVFLARAAARVKSSRCTESRNMKRLSLNGRPPQFRHRGHRLRGQDEPRRSHCSSCGRVIGRN